MFTDREWTIIELSLIARKRYIAADYRDSSRDERLKEIEDLLQKVRVRGNQDA